MNRHVREVHNNPNRKTIKHIREGDKILCPVCREDFTHSASLKKHIIKFHEKEELKEKGLNPEFFLGNPLKRQKPDNMKTDLEQARDLRGICSNVKVGDEIYDATIEAAKHCPKLFQLLLIGTLGNDIVIRVINAIPNEV